MPSRVGLSDAARARIEWLNNKYGDTHPEVHAKLLEAGGHAAVMPPLGWFAQAFLERAVVSTASVQQVSGADNECHRNASEYYRRDPQRYQLVTGFGLSWDADGLGCWRPHSWVFDLKSGEIVETTLTRDTYYGVMLESHEAEAFASQYD